MDLAREEVCQSPFYRGGSPVHTCAKEGALGVVGKSVVLPPAPSECDDVAATFELGGSLGWDAVDLTVKVRRCEFEGRRSTVGDGHLVGGLVAVH